MGIIPVVSGKMGANGHHKIETTCNLDVIFCKPASNQGEPEGGIIRNFLEIYQDLVCWTLTTLYYVAGDSTERVTCLKSAQNFRGKTHKFGLGCSKITVCPPS